MGVCKGFGAAVCNGVFILGDFGSKALAEGPGEGGALPPAITLCSPFTSEHGGR